MKFVAFRGLVLKCLWSLLLIDGWYGRGSSGCLAFWSQITLLEANPFNIILRLSDKKSVVVSTVAPTHTAAQQGEVKTLSVFTRLPFSLGT